MIGRAFRLVGTNAGWLASGRKLGFDHLKRRRYVRAVPDGAANHIESIDPPGTSRRRFSRSYIDYFGRRLIEFLLTIQGLGAFGLITITAMVTRMGHAPRMVRPLVLTHLYRSGLQLLPMVIFLSMALGLVIIGQTVSLLSRVGANAFLGTVMVTVVVRELGPLITALLVLSRPGTANVIELGTARALGEVEALEGMRIDPIHYLVIPRVIGMALGVFSLTIYLILGALLSGYLWAFIQDVPLRPGDYFQQLAESLRGLDFILLALKTCMFGVIIAVVTCYHGLARPIRLQDVSHATVRAVAQSVILCVMLDAVFLVIYLIA